jgi:hypothetical protein
VRSSRFIPHTMLLFIAVAVIYGFKLGWMWYVAAVVIFCLHAYYDLYKHTR